MFNISIYNSENKMTNESVFETEEICMAWAKDQKFDLDIKEIYDFDLIKYGYNKDDMPKEIEFYEVDSLTDQKYKVYFIPPTEKYIIKNIDSEIQDQKETDESEESFVLVQKLKAHIRKINKKKIKSGEWPVETFLKFIQSVDIAQAERALNQASWKTYKSLVIKAAEFYTPDEMGFIIGLIELHEEKWQSVLGA